MGTLKGNLVMFEKRYFSGEKIHQLWMINIHKRFICQEQQHTSVIPVVHGLRWEDGKLSLALQDLHSSSPSLKTK